MLAECRRRSIGTIGAATSVDEATALEAAGVDVVVASGFEAGGHRPSFLRSADSSLTGLFALVPQVVDAVEIPVIAAGGIADGRTVAAALMLGASGVQVGTAFLACEESNVAPGYRAALLGASREPTVLTRAFSGRLARGIRTRLADYLESIPSVLPYPVASGLLAPLRRAALLRDRVEMMPLFAGQGAPLLVIDGRRTYSRHLCRRRMPRCGHRDERCKMLQRQLMDLRSTISFSAAEQNPCGRRVRMV